MSQSGGGGMALAAGIGVVGIGYLVARSFGGDGGPVQVVIDADTSPGTISVDGSGSSSENGAIDEYVWTVEGTQNSYSESEEGETAQFSVPDSGDYNVTLTVVDVTGASATGTEPVTVPETGNASPTADFNVNVDHLNIELDASPSSDPDGSIVSYDWTVEERGGPFSDSGSGQTFTTMVNEGGDYDIELTVEDNGGKTRTATGSASVTWIRSGPIQGTKMIVNESLSNQVWNQTIYQTQELTNNNGRSPENMVAKFFARGMEEVGLSYRVVWGFDPIDAPREQAVCGDGSVLGWWRDEIASQNVPLSFGQSNQLLTAVQGGGCGYVGGNKCAAPGGLITHEAPYTRISRDSVYRNVSGAMHEIGHNMGFRHDPNPGWGFNDHDNEEWNRTPTMSANDKANMCGDFVQERVYSNVNRHLYYNDCLPNYISHGVTPEGAEATSSSEACPVCQDLTGERF